MTRKDYRAYDEIVAGDIVDLGGSPRRVLDVSYDERDRLRWVTVNRIFGGPPEDGVHLYHCDLQSSPQYRFRGWFKRARSTEDAAHGPEEGT